MAPHNAAFLPGSLCAPPTRPASDVPKQRPPPLLFFRPGAGGVATSAACRWCFSAHSVVSPKSKRRGRLGIMMRPLTINNAKPSCFTLPPFKSVLPSSVKRKSLLCFIVLASFSLLSLLRPPRFPLLWTFPLIFYLFMLWFIESVILPPPALPQPVLPTLPVCPLLLWQRRQNTHSSSSSPPSISNATAGECVWVHKLSSGEEIRLSLADAMPECSLISPIMALIIACACI